MASLDDVRDSEGRDQQPVSIEDLIGYIRDDGQLTANGKAVVAVVAAMQQRLNKAGEQREDGGTALGVSATLTMYVASIEIDGVVVWHSEGDSDQELTADWCFDEYVGYLRKQLQAVQ